MVFVLWFLVINLFMVLFVVCFRGKVDYFNIEMCDVFNVFVIFMVLFELELRLKWNRVKIIGCGVNVLFI